MEWDHNPALAMRPLNADQTDYEPAQLDPRYIRPMSGQEHKDKTFGNHVPLSGDVSVAAKIKRVERKNREFWNKLIGTEPEQVKPKRVWPSRKFQNRKGNGHG